jgi:hypothetical protein
MANIKELIQSIEAADSSFDEKLAAINQMEETLVAMRQQEETAVQENVDLIVEAIKVMEDKVNAQLEIAKSIVPDKGDKGDKGLDGKQGKDGRDGKDGKDGINGKDGADGKDGVSVTDAKIDFDGSLIISLSTGQEINVGEVVAPELQEKIKLVTSGGAGTVLPSQTGNANKYLKTDGTALSWATVSGGSGTVTSVATSGTVNGITLTGGPITSSGTITLGGTLDLSSPPAIGGTSPAAVTATTLIGGGGSANYGQLTGGATTKAVEFQTIGSDSNIALVLDTKGTGAIDLASGSSGVNISNGGTVTAITRTAGGTGYTVAPTVTISAPTTAGGVQATATCTVTAGVVDSTFTITNAGSGYVEQPTITFTPVSGGSGATAYATVGSDTTIKSLGTNLNLSTPSGTALQVTDVQTGTVVNNWVFRGAAGTGTQTLIGSTAGTATNINMLWLTKGGSGLHQFATSGSSSNIQFQVANTASAVNYVQVTGGASGSPGTVTISAQGSSTDVDMALTPRGAGVLKFGTYTASALLPVAGYITIKDSGGTTRRLLVG